MYKEIHQQPDVLRETYKYNKDLLERIKKEISEKDIKTIIFAARGSSDNSGVYFKYLCEIYLNIPVSFGAPSIFTVYNSEVDYSNALIIGVSQSGQAQDVLSVMNNAKKYNATTIAITNFPNSPVAQAGDFHLFINAGEEKSVAATKTFTAQMYLLGLLVSSLTSSDELLQQLQNVPTEVERVFENTENIKSIAQSYKSIENAFVLGRGYHYSIAKEFALKLQETTYIKAIPFAISDFYHGPFALTDNESNFIIFAPADETSKDSKEIIEAVNDKESNVIIFSDRSDLISDKTIMLPHVSSIVMPYVSIVSAQLFAMYAAISKDLNPDKPRGLKKVTITI